MKLVESGGKRPKHSSVRLSIVGQSHGAPTLQSSVDLIRQIQHLSRLASSYALQFSRAEYQQHKVGNEGGSYLSISFPARAAYVDIRAFIVDSLRDIPDAALVSLSLSRPQVSEPALEAQFEFRLYLSALAVP